MPNRHTFLMDPVKEIISRYIPADGRGWVDPFCGEYSPAELRNDLNPDIYADYHLDALRFSKEIPPFDILGVLYDPPYSLRQTKECYNGFGIEKLTKEESQDAGFSRVKKELAKKICPGGLVLSFGWSSMGFGKDNGFEIIEIRLVPHGRPHNDTIITVERKFQSTLF